MPEHENETVEVEVETTADPIPETKATAPAPKAKKPRPKPRTLETLDTMDPKRMTETEKNLYIVKCREALLALSKRCDVLDANCKSAYEQFKNADAAYNALRVEVNNKLAFCKQAVDTCNKTINMIGGAHEC